MRMSQLFLPTLREVPSDAVVISHQLMLRAGMIRKVAAGIYTFLPLGLRVIKKITKILTEEMNKSGGQEILMPLVQPAQMWQESGRYEEYGPELLRFQDRKDTWFCLGPTHEEVVTTLVRDHVKSYKQLPLNLYQIQTKFRDEIRPRFGLMRGREFIMKDAYSFCADKKSQEAIYQEMSDCYHRIFTRCGLRFKAVSAATGSIGGDLSHEFQVLAQSGEDSIASCTKCGFTANVELAGVGILPVAKSNAQPAPMEEIFTPNTKTIESVCEYLGTPQDQSIKSLVYQCDDDLVLIMLRGDHKLSEAKLQKALGAKRIAMADENDILASVGPVGFLGGVGCKPGVKIVADHALNGTSGLVMGANKVDTHLKNVFLERDVPGVKYLDLREASPGDICAKCEGAYEFLRGIEVGHIFYLGQKYSKALNATFQSETGETGVMEMGCYGIGVGRTAAAAIEQNHDEKGIIWPPSLAPFDVHVVTLGFDDALIEWANKITQTLEARGLEVLLDDRSERAGVKLNDADLIGCPVRITLGSRGLKEGAMEVLPRARQADGAIMIKDQEDFAGQILAMLKELGR
jgi:prolyl-tRNA synthetase